MKSQFDGIVKVKKQLLDVAQMELLRARQKTMLIKGKISHITEEINHLQTPKSGSFSLVGQVREKMRLLTLNKEDLKRELKQAEMLVLESQELYTRANKEYEKMKYLQEKEREEFFKKLQKKEQIMLDEISIQLFARDKMEKMQNKEAENG